MEALCSNQVFNLILYDPTPFNNDDVNNNYCPNSSSFPTCPNFLAENPNDYLAASPPKTDNVTAVPIAGAPGRKKRRRRSSRVCKNKEEAESQRMTHIAVERNRRKLMNEHLAVLRSLMPESYVERVRLHINPSYTNGIVRSKNEYTVSIFSLELVVNNCTIIILCRVTKHL